MVCVSLCRRASIPLHLKKYFKELKEDLDIVKNPNNGNLESWAKQGVFLLNTSLTVCAGKAMSHKDIGWEQFTDKVISVISEEKKNSICSLGFSCAKQNTAYKCKAHNY